MLNLSEIFYSFQGESTFMGRPTLFLRLSECNLDCIYCDSKHSFTTRKTVALADLIDIVRQYDSPYVCITGGEPLLQKTPLVKLIRELVKSGKIISTETNGSISIKEIPVLVKRVIDVKTPSSGHSGSFLTENLQYITPYDEIKFLIFDRQDLEYAENFIGSNKIEETGCQILYSPNTEDQEITDYMCKWIAGSKKNRIFQPQLHKLIKEQPVYIDL
jgi:7-carboxy-7-deazaguanine synthase